MTTQMANPQQQYLKTQIETATQPQLLLMVFDAAVKKLHFSRRAIEAKQIEKAHIELSKVQRIFTELIIALDFEKGGDLAKNLHSIYDFVFNHLVQANIKQDVQKIDDVLPIVENLRDGWTKAVEKFTKEGGSVPKPTMPSFSSTPSTTQGTALGKVALKTIQKPVTPQAPLSSGAYSRPVAAPLSKPQPLNPQALNPQQLRVPQPMTGSMNAQPGIPAQADQTPPETSDNLQRPRLNLRG